MKIGILVPSISPQAGGSFTFVYSIISAIDNKKSKDFVFLTTQPEELRTIVRNTQVLKIPTLSMGRLSRLLATAIFAFKLISRREIFDTSRVPGYFLSRFIKNNDIDILWSIEPLGYPWDMPYVPVHWDLGHRMLPIFPEFSVMNSEWKRRDRRESRVLQQATIVCVGTQQGLQEIHSAYGIERRNCIIVPLPVQHDGVVRVEKRDPKLFLYPAQFWPHKNHITLMRAFARASSELGEEIRLVLPGLDKGNRQLAIEQAKTLSIQDVGSVPEYDEGGASYGHR